MRLIDADAFKEYIRNSCEELKPLFPDGGKLAGRLTEEFCKDIDEQPTIDTSNTSNTLGALDCVDRQKAIDESYQVVIDGDVFDVVQVETLMGLPSTQPELIRCKDCKSWGRLVTYKDGSTMIDCKRGRSIDPEGYCHLAELRGDSDDSN